MCLIKSLLANGSLTKTSGPCRKKTKEEDHSDKEKEMGEGEEAAAVRGRNWESK